MKITEQVTGFIKSQKLTGETGEAVTISLMFESAILPGLTL